MRGSEAGLEIATRRLPTALATAALLCASALFCAVAVHAFDAGDRILIAGCIGALGAALLLLLSFEWIAVLAIGLVPLAVPLGYDVAKGLKLSGYLLYPLNLTTSQLLLALAVVALVMAGRKKGGHVDLAVPPWPVTAYALLGFVPLASSLTFVSGLSGILAVWSAWVLELVLLNMSWHMVKRCLLVLAGTTVVGVLVALAAYMSKLGPLAGVYARIYKPATFTTSGAMVPTAVQSFWSASQLATLGHRLNFDTNHPNAYGAFLMLATILGLTGIALMQVSRRRKAILTTAYLAIVLTALVLTLSRTSVSAMAVSLLCLGALLFHNQRLRRVLLGLALVGILVAASAPYFLNPASTQPLIHRFATLTQASQDASLKFRLQLFGKLLSLLDHHPLGMGYGFFDDPQLPGRLGIDYNTAFGNGHNIHLDVAVESGIPSALVFAAIWILAAREGYRLYRRKGEAELVGTFTLAGIVGLLTLSLTNAKPIEDPMPMMAMFILFVLPYCARRELT